MRTLESMRRRIESAKDLYAVVRVMKALAVVSIRQFEIAVESLNQYRHTVEVGLQAVFRNRTEASIVEKSEIDERWGVIVFGSDQGMCGSFNEQISSYALEQINNMSANLESATLLVVGKRIVDRLEDAGCIVSEQFSVPNSVSGIIAVVQDLLLKVEELRSQKRIEQFLVIHHKMSRSAGSQPSLRQLLPIDRVWLASLARRKWPSRSMPTFTTDWPELFSALMRQHLFVALFQAVAESLASENASRLASMQAAEKNIQDHISSLTARYHQARQQSITEELLDIVAGFESLTTSQAESS